MVRFSRMEIRDGELVETLVRNISQQQLAACPHYIFNPVHYRPDGTCKCNDHTESIMAEWGYTWSKRNRRWR